MIITENELDVWVRGHAREAQGMIVELIWRLVSASSPNPKERRFPLGDSIGQHGPDGVLDVDYPYDPFVPEGMSFWEIGTSIDAGNKATRDYKDLTDATPEDVRRESTFIFVTPLSGRRDWEHTWKEDAQADWLHHRRALTEWRDVRVIDGTKLIDWLKHFPSVELWLAGIMRLPVEHIDTPESHWGVLRTIGEPPPLTPNVFLTNRDQACLKLREIFAGNATHLKLDTRFPEQVVDFIAAYVGSLESEGRADVSGRCVVISSVDAWNAMVSHGEKHVLIADSRLDLTGDIGTKLIQKARRAGHSVIYGGSPGGIPDPTAISLPAPRTHQLKEALENGGYSDERARILSQRSAGNLGSLLRCLQNLSLLPEWAENSAAGELAIAAALGSWSEESDADRMIVEGLSGKTYGEWIETMREVALRPGAPLTQRNGNWRFVARYEGWYALGPRLFDQHVDAIQSAAVRCLQERDPEFDLPREERYAASIRGKKLMHSFGLRNGLAETLALLGSHPKALLSCSPGKAEAMAALAVRGLLADANWETWAGLTDVLPLLAEASPTEFLKAVENAVALRPSPFDELFAQEGDDGFLGRTYMSGLLWALETLAWHPDLLHQVVMCLGELAARDPGGRWANRPANSLTTIFLPWLPQTCASMAKRSGAVQSLMREIPDIGWKLLLSLLPEAHSTSSGSRRPAWREFIPEDWTQAITRREYLDQIRLYSELAVEAAKKEPKRLGELVSHLENLPVPARKILLDYLGSDVVTSSEETDRHSIWSELVDLVTKHRKYADAEWAMNAGQVEEIEAVADRLSPHAPALRHQRLFGDRELDLFEEKGNYQEQRERVEQQRQQALAEIADDDGVNAVLDFAASVQSPWRAGISFGLSAPDSVDEAILPKLLETDQKALVRFAGGFVWGRFSSRGWSWVDHLSLGQWTRSQVGEFLAYLPFAPPTWERATRFLGPDESPFWTKTGANPYDTKEGLEYAIDKLLQYGRPHAAIEALDRQRHEEQTLDTDRIVRVLLAALTHAEEGHAGDSYKIVELIKALQNGIRTKPEDLFRVEWAYLPLLDRHQDASPKFLEMRLATDPGFYCEVIRAVFKSKKTDRPAEPADERTKKLATNAYRLLTEWRTPPGCVSEGYDAGALAKWLDAVRRECEETGHLEIAMTMLGGALVHTPPDSDGLWIHRAAASVLNDKDAGDMRSGFSTALFNLRGVHGFSAGKEERELAAKYRAKADAVEAAGYHRLAVMLRELATSYDHDAAREAMRHEHE